MENNAVIGDISGEKSRYLIRFSFKNKPCGGFEDSILRLFRASQYSVNPQSGTGSVVSDYMTSEELKAAFRQFEDTFAMKAKTQ